MSGFSKVIPLGKVAELDINEQGGAGSVVVKGGGVAGGGSLAGVASLKVALELDLSVRELVDAALLAAEAKWSVAAPEIAALKAVLDAAMAQV